MVSRRTCARWQSFLKSAGLASAVCLTAAVCLQTTPALAEAPAPATVPAPATKKLTDEDYELYQIFADTLDQVQRNYVKDVSRRELMEAAIHGVLGKLDPYSNYISPDDIGRFKSSVEHQFGGIGIQIGMEEGQLKIISPMFGTPAYRAGLESGDAILEIEGKSTEGIQIDEAVKQLKGEAGTKVSMTIRHPGSREKTTVTLNREVIQVETVLGDHRRTDDSWDFMLDHDKHIGYIRLTAFSRETTAELRRALAQLEKEGLKGLIVDLRFNPGGLLSTAIEVSDLFIADGRIVSTKGRNTPERVWDAEKEGTYEGFPMAVLVNHYSASASEILSACLQDHKRAVVIGERTWGKGSVQNVVELEGGRSALKLTTASYHRPSGKNIHRFPDAKETDEWGVMPDPGFELKLNDAQTSRLIHYRHDRDILVGRHAKELATKDASAKEPQSAAKPDEPKVEEPKKEEPKPDAPKADEPKPEAPKPEADKAAADKPDATAKPDAPATRPEPKPEGKPEAGKADPGQEGAKAAFVDLQLQKAIDYLNEQLAKAQ